MITFDAVTYHYPRREAASIHGFDWQVAAGDFILLTGPSGAGKSTVARCINGLIPHFHGGRFGGRVLVGDHDTRTTRPADISRLVGLVAQDPESQTVMDRVEDEIAFGPENHGLSRAAMRLRVEEALDLLGIAGLREREIASLSGGERQRVVIAAAMAMRPPVLVLDEPTSQLDPWAAEEVLAILERLNADLGTTIVLIEHRLERALGLCQRLTLLGDDGRITADGPPAETAPLLEEPPPLVRLARALGWQPVPLTVRDARRAVAASTVPLVVAPGGSPPPVSAPPLVEMERLSFAYGEQTVLRDITLGLAPGVVTALMGRNGSGKTTLLKTINGLLRPSSGRVRLDGADIARRGTAELARNIGYLPQNPSAMLFNDTVEAELRFTLRCQGRPGDISGTLAALGIADLAARNPLDLSTGERQRVALAAILVARPRVLLLDEPTRGLDARRKRELASLLRRLAGEGVAVVMATHDVEMVAECADRVLLLAEGQVVADGTPRQVLTGSLTHATQINRVFGGQALVPGDILRAPTRDPAATVAGPD